MIFVDTSVFYARLAEDDRHHQAADEFFRTVTRPLVTTREVIFESHAMMLKISRLRPAANMESAAGRFLEAIDNGLAKVILATDADHEAARAIIAAHRDKDFSLCDALSFAIMERLGITVAASFDRHFRQYGRFTVLP
ncbi:MAG TPA: PIN domain-containing protein [Polyangia bacterium]|nr:PIN domain-containing protein [Polyangia bacterium]